MPQYIATREGAEVNSAAVKALVDAFGEHEEIAYKILAKHGIRRLPPDGWVPWQSILDILKSIAEKLGEHTLFSIGKMIQERALWPPEVNTVHAALATCDIAFHLNHRLNGQVLFDPTTGVMSEGIGHYHYKYEGPRRATMVVECPLPCDFDRGLLMGICRRFTQLADVTEINLEGCRKKGGASCTYVVRW